MVGSGESRRKEAVGMMALHEALRNVCINSDWTYSVFWTIRPRPRVRGGNGCKVGDDNGSLMLMWEDGCCRGSDCLDQMEREDLVRKAFSKMSVQLYNYGEGLMGKVASDKCHKWVFKEPTENETNVSNYWQSSFDALPSEWTDQFESGIQTIAVIQAGHGLLQLGSCKIIAEDLHFVLRMRHTFESLGYQSGYYLSQLFSSTRTISASSTFPLKQHINTPIRPPPVFNWGSRPNPSANSLHAYPNFQNAAMVGGISHSSELAQAQTMENHHENDDIKWPNGLTIFSALTCQSDDSRLLFNADSLSSKTDHNQHAMNHDEKTSNPTSDSSNQDGFLSLESHFG